MSTLRTRTRRIFSATLVAGALASAGTSVATADTIDPQHVVADGSSSPLSAQGLGTGSDSGDEVHPLHRVTVLDFIQCQIENYGKMTLVGCASPDSLGSLGS